MAARRGSKINLTSVKTIAGKEATEAATEVATAIKATVGMVGTASKAATVVNSKVGMARSSRADIVEATIKVGMEGINNRLRAWRHGSKAVVATTHHPLRHQVAMMSHRLLHLRVHESRRGSSGEEKWRARGASVSVGRVAVITAFFTSVMCLIAD